MKAMTDKEKLLKIIEISPDRFESIVLNYITHHINDFDAIRVHNLINEINNSALLPMIVHLQFAKQVSWERALYLKTYLEGGMYTTKEAEIEARPLQVGHAEKIMEMCGKNIGEDVW